MKKTMVGLNTYLYEFSLKDKVKFLTKKEKLSRTGQITEVFVNNKFAFEHKANKKIG